MLRIPRHSSALSLLALGVLLTTTTWAEPATRSAQADSAGPATVYDTSHNAFGRPLANLPASLWQPLRQGKQVFSRVWVPTTDRIEGPVRGRIGEGLGPLFAADRCTACHFKDGRGAREAAAPLLARLGVETTGEVSMVPEPTYGAQLQPQGVPGVVGEGWPEIVWREHTVQTVDGEELVLRRPEIVGTALAYGIPQEGARWSLRMPPTLVGLGLLEAVPEASILAWADADDLDGDGISGRPQWLPFEGQASGGRQLGRFGWKAGQGDLERQAAAALQGDLGVASSLAPGTSCTPAQVDCLAAAAGEARLEISDHHLARLALYLRLLGPPARRGVDDPEVVRGERVFHSLGCAQCHRPELPTRDDAQPAALAGLILRPYTDLLLHDLGPGLADGLREHQADGAEWRTPPLWGLGLVSTIGGGPVRLLHDGRARSISEAIVWHGGEAEASREGFLSAVSEDRQALLKFLESL